MEIRGRDNRLRRGIPIDALDAPAKGSDAGDATDLRDERLRKMIGQYRAAANRHAREAVRRLGFAQLSAEQLARRALDAAARAFWWAEGTDQEERQHQLLHKLGRWTRREFGCSLTFENGTYTQRCPVAIAHKRVGLSPGFIADRECSICGEDLSECPHRKNRTYWVRGGPQYGRACPVCLRPQCQHHSDRLYRAEVVSIIRHVRELREVSFVDRPAQPEARLTALPVETANLARALGPNFHVGVRVSCDLCLDACPGFDTYRPQGDSATDAN